MPTLRLLLKENNRYASSPSIYDATKVAGFTSFSQGQAVHENILL